jgi:uncharacterized membrane protein YdjX (TVP38/TMEM64 family)
MILIPFFLWEDRIATLAATWTTSGTPPAYLVAAIVGLLAADVVLPVPSSIVSVSAGSLLGFPLGFLVTWTGMMLGCCVGYWLGWAMEPWVRKRLMRTGDWDSLREMLAHQADLSMLLSRPVPVFAEAVVLASGVLKLAPFRLLAIAAAGNAAIATLYAAAGAYGFAKASFLAAFAVAILVPWLGMRLFRRWLGANRSSL